MFDTNRCQRCPDKSAFKGRIEALPGCARNIDLLSSLQQASIQTSKQWMRRANPADMHVTRPAPLEHFLVNEQTGIFISLYLVEIFLRTLRLINLMRHLGLVHRSFSFLPLAGS